MCYNIINVGVGSLAVVGSTTYLLAYPDPECGQCWWWTTHYNGLLFNYTNGRVKINSPATHITCLVIVINLRDMNMNVSGNRAVQEWY